MIFTHIEAAFEFKVTTELEFGLQKHRYNTCYSLRKQIARCNQAWYALIPVSEGHHHIQSSESEHEMKEAPVVRYFLLLIVPHLGVVSSLHVRIVSFYWSIIWLHSGKREITQKKKEKKTLQMKPVNKNVNIISQIKCIFHSDLSWEVAHARTYRHHLMC